MLNVDVLMFDVWPRKTNKLAEFVEKYLVVNDGGGLSSFFDYWIETIII